MLTEVSKFGGPSEVTRQTDQDQSEVPCSSVDWQRLSILDHDSCAAIFGQKKWNLVALIKTHMSLAKKTEKMRFSAACKVQ